MAAVDVATLGIKVDASQADQGKIKLEELAKAGDKAQASAKKLGTAASALNGNLGSTASAANAANATVGGLGATAANAGAKMNAAGGAAATMAERVARLKASVDPLGTAQDRVNDEMREAAVLYAAGAIDADRYANSMAMLNARATDLAARQSVLNARILGTVGASRLSATEALNLSRQFADIGVTAAMGMNPLMILIQQGPQIADIMKTSGLGVKGLGQEMVRFIAPAMRFIGPLAIIAGIGATLFATLANEAEDGLGDVRKEFALTEGQMKRLKDEGTDLGVTMGDAWNGFKETVKDVFVEAFGPQIEAVKGFFQDWYDYTLMGAIIWAKGIVGAFVGSFRAIQATWSMLPAAMGDAAISAVNLVIGAVAKMVNASIEGINGLISMLPDWVSSKTGTIDFRMSGTGLENPYAGKSQAMTDAANKAGAAGFAEGGQMVSNFGRRLIDNTREAREARIRQAAGDAEKGPRAKKARKSDEEKDYERAVEGAENYIKALREETEAIGMNELQVKRLATSRAQAEISRAAELMGTETAMRKAAELTAQMAKEQERWEQATANEHLRLLKQDLSDMGDELAHETRLIGMNNEAREKAMAQREIDIRLRQLERDGWKITPDLIQAETDAILNNAAARGRRQDATEAANRTATAMRDVANAVRETTESFGELFGTAGEGFANLLNTMLDFDARQADSRARLIELQEEYNNGQVSEAEMTFERGRINEQMAQAQLAHYGNMLSAAKSFFSEGSTGFKVLEAAERAYRIFQFAMQIRAMFMDNASTASSVANSGARAAADGVAAIAKAIASLPFPLNIIAGAATAAALVAFGVKVLGGKGKGASASSSASSAVDSYNGPRDEYGAPTSSYSVLRPGATTVANDNRITPGGNASRNVGNTVVIHGDKLEIQGGADRRTVEDLNNMLNERDKNLVQQARRAVAADQAASAGRQRIGGGN